MPTFVCERRCRKYSQVCRTWEPRDDEFLIPFVIRSKQQAGEHFRRYDIDEYMLRDWTIKMHECYYNVCFTKEMVLEAFSNLVMRFNAWTWVTQLPGVRLHRQPTTSLYVPTVLHPGIKKVWTSNFCMCCAIGFCRCLSLTLLTLFCWIRCSLRPQYIATKWNLWRTLWLPCSEELCSTCSLRMKAFLRTSAHNRYRRTVWFRLRTNPETGLSSTVPARRRTDTSRGKTGLPRRMPKISWLSDSMCTFYNMFPS